MDPSSPNYRQEMIPVGNVIRFYTTKPSPPAQGAPSNGSAVSGSTIMLWWSSSDFTDSARVQLSLFPDFALTAIDTTVIGNSVEVSGLDDGKRYFWRLRSTQSGWSAPWDFSIVEGTSTNDDNPEIPDALEIAAVYPVPAQQAVTIRYGLPFAAVVSVDVFDILGRLVSSSLTDRIGAGWHELKYGVDDLAPGVYLIRLRDGSAQISRKVVVL